MDRYLLDPVGYAHDVMRVELTPQQAEIAMAILEPPFRIQVQASNTVGKTFLAALLCSWWFDTRDPGLVISTAPNMKQVENLLWKEIRLQRGRAGLPSPFSGPVAPSMFDHAAHWAKGFTSTTAEGFKGQHGQPKLIVFDEAVGIGGEIWEAADSFFERDGSDGWLSIGNPTDMSSVMYSCCVAMNHETGEKPWRVFRMSGLEHPNIKAQLEGMPKPFQYAIDLETIDGKVRELCELIPESEAKATDVQWPPLWAEDFCRRAARVPLWYRPGPVFEASVLGNWPSQGWYGVWSEADWNAAERASCDDADLPSAEVVPEIGCDVAVMGDDWSSFHVRCGNVSLFHQRVNGWRHPAVAGRCMELCREWADWLNRRRDRASRPVQPQEIPVKVDDSGVGSGVTSIGMEQRYRFIGVNAGTLPHDTSKYVRRRDELWFDVVERARNGALALGRLPRDILERLRSQALAPIWWLDSMGRRQVEPKSDTKARTGTRSPDDVDGMCLAYAEAIRFEAPKAIPRSDEEQAARRSFMGYRGEDKPESRARRPGFMGYRRRGL